jgi:hypothetical protein
MRCDFCGEDIEGIPLQKEGMNFCSLECSDAMETGESIHLGEDVLDDPDDDVEDEEVNDEDEKDDDEDEDDENQSDDEYLDDELIGEDEHY